MKTLSNRRGARRCAEWLSQCLALGWSRELLDDMEALWQAYHKRDGSLMTAAEAREAKGESDANECQHEWIPRPDYGFDICRKCHTTRQIKAAEAAGGEG